MRSVRSCLAGYYEEIISNNCDWDLVLTFHVFVAYFENVFVCVSSTDWKSQKFVVWLTCTPYDGINSTCDSMSAANDRSGLRRVCVVFRRRRGRRSGRVCVAFRRQIFELCEWYTHWICLLSLRAQFIYFFCVNLYLFIFLLFFIIYVWFCCIHCNQYKPIFRNSVFSLFNTDYL